LGAPSPLLWAQLALQYQQQGDRCEGIKTKPVSGYDSDLISALVDYQKPFGTKGS